MLRVLVVANPRATAISARQREGLRRALSPFVELEVTETANRGHAAALACRAMRRGTDVVVALGGDGTVNEVVNGLLTDGPHEAVPALGVVPAGSTNVFVRALGLPNDPEAATALLVQGLRSGARRPISLGQADGRYFCFAAGLGLDAAIVRGVEAHRRRGARSTHLLYARVGVREFFRADRRHPGLTVELPDGTRLERIFFTVVTNTDPWTFVGNRPLRPTPEVSLESGLGLYARRRMGTAGVLFSMARIMGDDPRIGRRGAYTIHDFDALTVLADEPVPLQVDGDAVGPAHKVSFRSLRNAIQVVAKHH